MLVLSRKKHETIRITDDIAITVIGFDRGRVKIGISAPSDVRVWRGELLTPPKEGGTGSPSGRTEATATEGER